MGINMIEEATDTIKNSNRMSAFTGAGISVESGVPPFRGENGLWSEHDPSKFRINYFKAHPEKSWQVIRDEFFSIFNEVEPNQAHKGLAQMEQNGFLNTIITQNIDNLHQEAGSEEVYEFHGNSRYLVCLKCGNRIPAESREYQELPPKCEECGGLLKPDFIFFGEPIPELARNKALEETKKSDLFLLIGTTGEVMPASRIPLLASQNGATIIEINIQKSNFTDRITDIFLKGKATKMVQKLVDNLLR